MSKQEAIFWSLWMHLMFVLIHTFNDGNGRAARLLEKWFLTVKLGRRYWCVESEKYYWQNLAKYYKTLKLGVNYWEINFIEAKKFFKR